MLSRTLRLATRALALVAVLPPVLLAQGERKVLTQETYDLWRGILQPTLSPDGRWAVYTLSPTMGDGHLVVRATSGSTEHRVQRGSTGRPLQSVNGRPFTAQAAQITGDSRHVVFLQYPTQGALDSARARRARPADQPKPSLGILALADGRVTSIEKVRGFQMGRDGGDSSCIKWKLTPRPRPEQGLAVLAWAPLPIAPRRAQRPVARTPAASWSFANSPRATRRALRM